MTKESKILDSKEDVVGDGGSLGSDQVLKFLLEMHISLKRTKSQVMARLQQSIRFLIKFQNSFRKKSAPLFGKKLGLRFAAHENVFKDQLFQAAISPFYLSYL